MQLRVQSPDAGQHLQLPASFALDVLASGPRVSHSITIDLPVDAIPGMYRLQIFVDSEGIPVAQSEIQLEIVP